MLGEALSYPRYGDDWLKRIGIGGLLIIFSWLIIPGILLYGYFVRVLRSAAMDEEMPPAFDDWAGMLVDGLKLIVINIAYFIVPYAVFLAAFFATSGSGSGSVVGTIVVFVAGIASLVAAYTLPVAMTNFALHDSMGAAFEFRTVFSAAFTGRYLVAVILTIVVGGILSFIATILSVILVGLFLLFYVQVFGFYLQGTGCGPQLHEKRTGEIVAD
jgi:hypothetical protein